MKAKTTARDGTFPRAALGLLVGILSVLGLLILLSTETSARPPLQATPEHDLVLSVEHDPILFSPLGRMTYTISYRNKEGFDRPESAVITATVPQATEYVDIGYDWSAAGDGVYTYSVPPDRLDPGTMQYLVHFVVRSTNSIQIGVREFNSWFAIASEGGLEADANPEDNVAEVTIGVPDLWVTDFAVEPYPLQANVPVTLSVTMRNDGTGVADNPANPGGGTSVGVFLEPIASYPSQPTRQIYDYVPPIPAGEDHTEVITRISPFDDTRVRFTDEQVRELDALYAKADSHPQNAYGLVPEYDEFNNVGVLDLRPYKIYLPLVMRNW